MKYFTKKELDELKNNKVEIMVLNHSLDEFTNDSLFVGLHSKETNHRLTFLEVNEINPIEINNIVLYLTENKNITCENLVNVLNIDININDSINALIAKGIVKKDGELLSLNEKKYKGGNYETKI